MSDTPKLKTGLSAYSRIGSLAVLALFGIFFWWSYSTEINGAVIATGSVVIEGKPKQVQHFDGGVVEDILVKEGDVVEANQTLVLLDKTLLEANLSIYKGRLAEMIARKSRLRAEQAELSEIAFEELPKVINDFDFEEFKEGQIEVFNARRDLQTGKDDQLKEKIVQFGNQTKGVEGLLIAKRKQLHLIGDELIAKEEMRKRDLIVASEVSSIQRAQADFEGQISEHISELARIKNSIQDAKIEILLNKRQFKEQVVTEQREISTQIGELTQQILSTLKQLERVALRAPVAGVVHEMQVFTRGGVVPPGGTVLQIVPQNDQLSFELRVDPGSIDQVYLLQDTRVVFSAFNQRTTPELIGTVVRISPTSIVDQATGLSYYIAEIGIEQKELKKLGDLGLVPGMPVDAFLQTDTRSVLNYFVRPLSDQVMRAFREE